MGQEAAGTDDPKSKEREGAMENLTRRNFLTLGGIAAASAGALACGCTPAQKNLSDTGEEAANQEATDQAAWDENDTVELPVPDEAAPKQTSYTVDVLVAGCGYAGLNAAVAAKQAGKSVLVVDKGYPGYSGLSPFAVNSNYFDPDFGDDVDKTLKLAMQANEYLANLNWMRVWCEKSKEYFQRITDWGITNQYPHASETEYWVDGCFDGNPGHDDKRGYFRSVTDVERHPAAMRVIEDNGIELLHHSMVYDVVEQDGRVVGAMALHTPSATPIAIQAKAVVLCTGSGCVKPVGFPVGGSSYDGLAIGYKHGLPIGGMEFEDYHLTYGGNAGLILTTAGWAYCENIAPGGPGVNANTPDEKLWGSAYQQRLIYTNVVEGLPDFDPTKQRVNEGRPASDDPNDIRQGNFTSPETSWSAPGAAPGMSLHMASGIFNGWDDIEGRTGLAGLYCAGDGTYASAIGGSNYDGISGLTTSSCGVQGWCAGEAAAAYADAVAEAELPGDAVQALSDEILAPLSAEKGYSPVWVNEQLSNAIANQNVLYLKSETSLNSALNQVEFIRDNLLPKLKARNAHEVRLCREVEQKVLACEIKLRVSLERKESRGMHYRTDYPYRDDQYLGYFTATKNGDGMSINFVEVPDEWKGDLNADYATRYPNYRFPGETEAKNLPPEEPREGSH